MAEGAGLGGIDVRLRIIGAVVIVLFSVALIVLFRSCGTRDPNAGYTVIYSNLELKDAAGVITQLKAIKVPYQIRDNGTAVAVPKERADEARLGLAEKNLPMGGSVGWEIFDQSKFGTTDFDRTIQFMRAISGELARTIKRIEAVQDARVQIVIPKTELFAVTQAPVTASVLLQIKPGMHLSREQTSGILRLVASSVENLRTENVTIVDVYGNILSGARIEAAVTPEVIPEVKKVLEIPLAATKEVILTRPAPSEGLTKEVSVVEIPVKKILTPEETLLTGVKAKQELENLLSSRIQKLVNNFYPPNSILVKVTVEIEDKPVKQIRKRYRRFYPKKAIIPEETAKIIKNSSVIVLIDNRFQLTPVLRKTTFDTIASAIAFNPKRGDRITIAQVPFHYASEYQVQKTSTFAAESLVKPSLKTEIAYSLKNLLIIGGSIFAVLVIAVIFIRAMLIKRKEKASVELPLKRPGFERDNADIEKKSQAIDQIRNSVTDSPEKIAELLKKWLSEEEEGA